MRVVHYCSKLWPARGGAERQLDRLLAEQVARGDTPIVVTLGGAAEVPGVKVVRVPPSASLKGTWWRVASAVRSEASGADCVHCHGVGPLGLAAVVGARAAGKGVVSGLRSSGDNADHLKVQRAHPVSGSALWRTQYRLSTRLAVKTRRMSDELQALGYGPRNVRVVPNGIDSSSLRCTAPSQQQRTFVYVGRMIVDVKGLDVLSTAWKLGTEDGWLDRWKLELWGEGPGIHDVKSLFGERADVSFMGTTDHIDEAFARAAFAILPSRVEGFSNTLLEALACGRPVIGTQVSGTEDVVDDTCGLLVPPGDVIALSRAMQAASSCTAAQFERWSQGAVARARRYDMAEIADRWDELYRELAST